MHVEAAMLVATTPVQIRLPEDELGALDNYRREQKNPPSRAGAVRELIRRVLSEHKLVSENSCEGAARHE
jgi:metal-responsive CopG/Arc/MetJ family transcriptional regulator